MADLKAWRVDYDSLIPDRKTQQDPPGYDAAVAKDPIPMIDPTKKKDKMALGRKQAALMARAMAPIKNVGMMCFMAYMFGNGIQIFSIFMIFNLVSSPISAILSSGEAFPKDADYENLDVWTPRALYCLIHLGQFVFGLYKLASMRLLPSAPSDFISTMPVPPVIEHAFAPL